MLQRVKQAICKWLVAASHIYLVAFGVWLLAYLVSGDHIGYLGITNFLAVYFFLPMPIVLCLGIACRRRELLVSFGLGTSVFLWFWGALFIPSHWYNVQQARAESPSLTVMTYNVLARHTYTEAVIATIRAENPDIILLQEVNTVLAQALENQLEDIYPYQVLKPIDNPAGIGIISKYPLQPSKDYIPLKWVGGPLIAELDWDGQTVTLVDFHMHPTTRPATPDVMTQLFRYREAQAALLANYARNASPVILAGDANITSLSDAYKILTADLHDSWQQAGFGFGHTFPGKTEHGSRSPRMVGITVPSWLFRIDYILHSEEWETVSAWLGQQDGVADHRSVVAILRWKGNSP